MAAWLVLLIYPGVVYLVVQPRAFRLVHKRKPGRLMTSMELLGTRDALEKDLEQDGRWLLVGKLLLAAALLFAWMKRYGFAAAQLGVISDHLATSLATGLVAGALLVCGRMIFHGLAPHLPGASNVPTIYPQSRGPVAVWLITLVLGTIFEEPWRACCLLSFEKAGLSQIFGVIASSIAFMFAWTSGFPPRIPSTNFEDVWEFLVGAFLAFLFLRFHTVVSPFVASMIYNLVNLALVRRATRTHLGAT